MAARKKSEVVRRNKPRVVELAEFRERSVPGVPFRFRFKSTGVWWESFWLSPVGLLVSVESDLPVVVRLVSLLELREAAVRSVRVDPLVVGSQGQPVENPLAKAMSRYDSEIRALEDRLGLSPRARLSLNISLGAAKKSLDELVGSGDVEVEDDFGGVLDV